MIKIAKKEELITLRDIKHSNQNSSVWHENKHLCVEHYINNY